MVVQKYCLVCAPYVAVDVVQDVVIPCQKAHILMELWEHSPEVAVIQIPRIKDTSLGIYLKYPSSSFILMCLQQVSSLEVIPQMD